METQYIRVPSEADRSNDAARAIVRHDALPPQVAPINALQCCAVPLEYREGGATLTSIHCPACGRRKGAWSLGPDFITECWNTALYNERKRAIPMPELKGFRLVPILRLSSHWAFSDSYSQRGEASLYWHGIKFADGVLTVLNLYALRETAFANMPRKGGLCWSLQEQGTCLSDWWGKAIPANVESVSIHAENGKWHDRVKGILGPGE